MGKESRNGMVIDPFTEAIPIIDEEHFLIHQGVTYFTFYMDENVGDGGMVELWFKSPPARQLLHLVVMMESSLGAKWYVYEGCTKTYNVTNKLTAKNRHRSKPDSNLLVCHTPSGEGEEDAATLLKNGLLGGGSGPRSIGGSGRTENEFLPKPNTAYLLRVVSIAANNIISVGLEYYNRFHPEVTTTTTTSTTTTTV